MMKYWLLIACLIDGVGLVQANSETTTPDYQQVREILRTNLPGITDAELDRHALDGLLQGLRDRAWFASDRTNAAGSGIAKSLLLEGNVAYVRAERVAGKLAEEVRIFCETLDATNQLHGLVLDLRFANGDDYAAAAAVADLFIASERGLLDWGEGVVKSSLKTDAFNWPVVVVVNGETMGAAEALAEVMRAAGSALILGNATRGAAVMAKEFPLTSGQRLRVAATPVRVVGSEETKPIGVVRPDIQVNVSLADERAYLRDPYVVISNGTNNVAATNQVARRSRPSEADLVRAHRSGVPFDAGNLPPIDIESQKPLLRDPALARAVDLLKGLAVVRRTR